MLYTVSGDYSYDISTYEFLDHSSARVSVDSFHAGDYFTYSVKNENSNVRVNGNQIKFTGSFSLDVTVIFGKTIGFGPILRHCNRLRSVKPYRFTTKKDSESCPF